MRVRIRNKQKLHCFARELLTKAYMPVQISCRQKSNLDMKGRSSASDAGVSVFGQRINGGLERAFDLRDPYKLNRAPLLRGGKRGLSSLGSYACVALGIALLVGTGVLMGRELVRPPKRSWEGEASSSRVQESLHALSLILDVSGQAEMSAVLQCGADDLLSCES